MMVIYTYIKYKNIWMDFTEMDFILMNSIETSGDLDGYK